MENSNFIIKYSSRRYINFCIGKKKEALEKLEKGIVYKKITLEDLLEQKTAQENKIKSLE